MRVLKQEDPQENLPKKVVKPIGTMTTRLLDYQPKYCTLVCSSFDMTTCLDAGVDLSQHEAANENAQENRHDIARSPGLTSGGVDVPIVGEVQSRIEGQGIVGILHKPRVALYIEVCKEWKQNSWSTWW